VTDRGEEGLRLGPGGILIAFALSSVPGIVDHTYVISDRGDKWPCRGRSDGGDHICDGPANLELARCLAQADLTAGISYGMTGVCHQIANRILLPAGITVATARGARLSMFAYGVYGRDPGSKRHYHPEVYPWPELARCRKAHSQL
jgi:hypothetical protein